MGSIWETIKKLGLQTVWLNTYLKDLLGKLPSPGFLRGRRGYLILGLLISLYALWLSYGTILRHLAFQSSALDLGVFTQCLWSTISGRGVLYSWLEHGSHFRVHNSPILFALVPIYALLPFSPSRK